MMEAHRADRHVPLFVLFVLFVFFVIVFVRVWGRVGCDGENLVDASCPLLLQTSMKLYRAPRSAVSADGKRAGAGHDRDLRKASHEDDMRSPGLVAKRFI